jgi:hypothetical protein
MLLTDAEILEMCQMAREASLELSLFVGPRAAWETGAGIMSSSGKTLGAQHRGQDQLAYALEDVLRGASLGLRGVLVADPGLLWVLRDLKACRELPSDLVVKVSVQLAAANAAAIKAMEQLGADTYNVPTDLSLAQLAAMRAQLCSVQHIRLNLKQEISCDRRNAQGLHRGRGLGGPSHPQRRAVLGAAG